MSAVNGKSNGARGRYVRHFVEHQKYILSSLTPEEYAAFMRVTLAFVERNGRLADDDTELARIARLRRKRWLSLREKVLDLGLARVEAIGIIYDFGVGFDVEQRIAANTVHRRRRAGHDRQVIGIGKTGHNAVGKQRRSLG